MLFVPKSKASKVSLIRRPATPCMVRISMPLCFCCFAPQRSAMGVLNKILRSAGAVSRYQAILPAFAFIPKRRSPARPAHRKLLLGTQRSAIIAGGGNHGIAPRYKCWRRKRRRSMENNRDLPPAGRRASRLYQDEFAESRGSGVLLVFPNPSICRFSKALINTSPAPSRCARKYTLRNGGKSGPGAQAWQ